MTAPAYELIVAPDADAGVVRLRLLDRDGLQVGAHQVRFADHRASLWEGLLDTRAHVRRYAGSTGTAEEILERLGMFLGESVLGPEITAVLAEGVQNRTLLVRLPETGADPLAAAFARVPWEIARPRPDESPGRKPLLERNLVVRAVTGDMDAGAWTTPAPGPDETVRVLLVFAEAPGSRPLAMRLEREGLLDLFYDEVLPDRRVEVDVLCHGVTREALRRRIEDASGYHVVHWSGHGHHDLLELHGEDGEPDRISGGELLELFGDAGGFLPHLVVLSACLSGTLVRARSWDELRGALRESEPETPAAATAAAADPPSRAADRVPDRTPDRTSTGEAETVTRPPADAERPGFAGTALALLRAGVPQVVAMRYEVGDGYARDLAHGFYRHLLADRAPKSPAKALSLARKSLLRAGDPAHHPVDHATPLVFGRDVAPLHAPDGRSPGLDRRRPRPQPLLPGSRELDRPERFVGRGDELTRLRTRWLDRDGPAVALVQGLGGLGKTALAAEAIHLWHRDFDAVFAFQSKPTPLALDDVLARLDRRLALERAAYRALSDQRPNARVHLPPREDLSGEERYRLLRDNLLDVLRGHRLLLVLDNFETHLEAVPTGGGHACADPEWDRLLAHLADNLPGTGSRLLITSRHRPAVLMGSVRETRTLWLPLGPLPMGQAVLFLQAHPALRALAHSDDAGWRLIVRLLTVSRGHPLILDRLAALADDRQALERALDRLEAEGLSGLPDVFTAGRSDAERQKEHDYLHDVVNDSLDLLLERLSPDARRLLRVVTLAFEPVSGGMVEGVWSGQTVERETLDWLRDLLASEEELPPELAQAVEQMPPELRQQLEETEGDRPDPAPPVQPLLAELTGTGLLTEEGGSYGFHELVRERVAAWVDRHPDEGGDRSDAEIWTAYGERYAARYRGLRTSGAPGSREAAAEMGRRALSYLVQARALDRLGSFASGLVTGTRDPALLGEVIARLRGVADELPPGEDRWSVRTYLADALDEAGRSDEALELFDQAAEEAKEAERWTDLGWILQNHAAALANCGNLDLARSTLLRSARAEERAGAPRIDVVGSELEALRIDVMKGNAESALPEVERRLDEVRGWWRRHQAQKGDGEAVPEAPEPIFLGRAYVSALDIAEEVNRALKRWQACLDLLEEIEDAERALGEGPHELARTRFNRYGPLLRLGRLEEAQEILEGCLAVFRARGDAVMESKTLSALADLWSERGDLDQAADLERRALALRNRLPDLGDRAISHNNLAIYLETTLEKTLENPLEKPFEKPGTNQEAAGHRLAAIVYSLVTGHGQALSGCLGNLRVAMRRAAAAGVAYPLPRLADLLARPEFSPVRETVAAFGADPEEIQAEVGELVEQIRRGIESGGEGGGAGGG